MRTKLRLIGLITGMTLCLAANRVVAQNYFTRTVSSGTETYTLTITSEHKFVVNSGGVEYDALGDITVNGGTLNLIFDNSDFVYQAGTIKVTKGNVNLSLGEHYTAGHPTLMRNSGFKGRMVYVESTDSDASNCKLTIQGEAGKHFVFDGNCGGFDIESDGNGGYTAVHGDSSVLAEQAIICGHGGTIDMDYVTLQKNWNTQSHPNEGGGAVNIYDYDSGAGIAKCESIVTMDSCLIDNCYAHNSGAALRMKAISASSVDTSSFVMNQCIVANCFSNGTSSQGGGEGGVIRTWGRSKSNLEMHSCVVRNNYNNNQSTDNYYGVIHWNAFQVKPLIVDGCLIENNWSRYHGGGLYLTSMSAITNSTIRNNRAECEGGGIYYSTYSRPTYEAGFVFTDGSLVLDDNTIVEGNSARNGGGLYIYVKLIQNGTEYITDTAISINLNVNGAAIRNNMADIDGGGVYMTRESDVVYHTAVNLNSGDIYNNEAVNYGGGVFVGGGVAVNVGSDSSDSLKVVSNHAKAGGGIYVSDSDIDIKNGYIGLMNKANVSTGGDGGGIYVNSGNLTMRGGNVSYNQAKRTGEEGGNAGGFYVNEGTVLISSGIISYNTAEGNGGAIYAASTVATDSILINGGDITSNSAAQHGGGIYIGSGAVRVTNGIIGNNEATQGFGGGLYLQSGTMTVGGSASAFRSNRAYNQGGGIHIEAGGFYMTGGTIGGSVAQGNYTFGDSSQGGGLYIGGGLANISGGVISGNYTNEGYGGGIYVEGGICTLADGATIGGAPNLGNPNDPNDDLYYTNSANFGAGIYSAGGIITLQGGKIQYNEAAVAGGGIYSNGTFGVVNVMRQKNTKLDVSSDIEYNTAQYGGGIFANRGKVHFSDGTIRFNYASEKGGGLYVNDNGDGDYGELYLKGSAKLTRNHVPSGKKGGGVYLKGVVTIGERVDDLGTIMANDNYAYTTNRPDTLNFEDPVHFAQYNAIRNNVYLPDPTLDYTYHKDVITVIEDGISTNTEIGFSVPRNYVPVIYCALSDSIIPATVPGYEGWHSNQKFLHQFSTGMPLQNNLFDDTHRYIAVHYANQPEIFDPNHVYLYGFWTGIVTTDPTGGNYADSLCNINTPEKLAYFISYVNGINDCTGHPHPDAEGTITADIDMSLYGWVPIGGTGGFAGTLHGNGHTITGISSLLFGDHLSYGLIGKMNGGTVEDLFVKDAIYALEYKDGLVIGGLVGETFGNANVKNCEVSASILATHPTTICGGLVGRTNAATDTIHSSIGIADISGYLMGGLVGDNKGVLLNSFANAKLTYKGSSQYFGGLVGRNDGVAENCYVRLRGDVPTSDYYGWLVGQNNNGASVNYCYTRGATGTPYFAANAGSLTGCGYYANNTQTPYLYARRDNQVTIANASVNNGGTANSYVPLDYDPSVVNPLILSTGADKQMMLCLNNWVSEQNGTTNRFAYWHRPTTKVINDDLPVLRMPSVDAVACTGNDDGTENESFLNYGQVNELIAAYPTSANNAAIWLYQSKDGIDGNAASGAKLYIAEGVTVIQNAPLEAYVGVTLLNKGGVNGASPTLDTTMVDYTDWHMFSSPLAAAPLGVHYTDDTQYLFSYGHSVDINNNPMPYYHFYDDENARGYFPSHRYGTTYGEDTDSPTAGGNYYQEWDYYTYYEPEYHWVNFKRNGNSHWHENAHQAQIFYDPYQLNANTTYNETYLIQGRGYLLATREETFLQCRGRLNNAGVTIPVTNDGFYSPGYNFLGNPYLAYLDFDAFVEANINTGGGGMWESTEGVGYAIIDEGTAPAGYKYYAYNSSTNPFGASQYIAPHQGFMIRLTSDPTDGHAYFTTNMRSLDGDGGTFRGNDRPAYPLVNLFAFDGSGNRDITTVELGRPDKGGAKLMRELKLANCHVYCRYEDDDWAIAFTQPGLSEAAIRFEAYEDGEFTLTWDTENGNFHYLHLIDNMTGVDVDCLAETEYRFTAKKDDFRSRFRLLFGYTDIEEGENGGQENTTFAFQSGDELVINGEGAFTMFDVTGREMMSTETHGAQMIAPLPDIATGVYLLRLETVNGTKVQKIVIK